MFTGSGAIEAACKQIVGQRAKQSGTHWTVDGAADIITLRCQHRSGRWDKLWPATPGHQPGYAPPSDRHHDSDTQARAAIKIIPNNPVVHLQCPDFPSGVMPSEYDSGICAPSPRTDRPGGFCAPCQAVRALR